MTDRSYFKHYVVTLRHDDGTIRIRTAASSAEVAIDIVLRAEHTPQSAVVSVREVTS